MWHHTINAGRCGGVIFWSTLLAGAVVAAVLLGLTRSFGRKRLRKKANHRLDATDGVPYTDRYAQYKLIDHERAFMGKLPQELLDCITDRVADFPLPLKELLSCALVNRAFYESTRRHLYGVLPAVLATSTHDNQLRPFSLRYLHLVRSLWIYAYGEEREGLITGSLAMFPGLTQITFKSQVFPPCSWETSMSQRVVMRSFTCLPPVLQSLRFINISLPHPDILSSILRLSRVNHVSFVLSYFLSDPTGKRMVDSWIMYLPRILDSSLPDLKRVTFDHLRRDDAEDIFKGCKLLPLSYAAQDLESMSTLHCIRWRGPGVYIPYDPSAILQSSSVNIYELHL